MEGNFTIFYHQIRDDLSISEGARLLYTFIEPLTRKYGRCFASNDFFQEKMGITKKTLLKRLNELEESGYVYRIVSRKKSSDFKVERHLFINYDSFSNFIQQNDNLVILKKTEKDISVFKSKSSFKVENNEENIRENDRENGVVKFTPPEGVKFTPPEGVKSTPYNNITSNNNIIRDTRVTDLKSVTEDEEVKNKISISKSFKDQILDEWKKIEGIPVPRDLTDKRVKEIRKLRESYEETEILEAIKNVGKSDFLTGKNNRGWTVNFDWFVNSNNFVKVLEGNYNNKKENLDYKDYGKKKKKYYKPARNNEYSDLKEKLENRFMMQFEKEKQK